MKGALVIFIAMVVIGIILYISDVVYFRKRYPSQSKSQNSAEAEAAGNNQGENSGNAKVGGNDAGHGDSCCGLHLVCEKTGLSSVTDEIIYYDDEELDRFKGREPDSYDTDETEEFREILLTLLPQDIAGWARSLQLRGISLPLEVRDELLMIVSELRHN